MTSKHYRVLAEMLRGSTCVQLLSDNPGKYILKETFIEKLADYLEADNPNFDRDKFYDASWYKKTPVVLK